MVTVNPKDVVRIQVDPIEEDMTTSKLVDYFRKLKKNKIQDVEL